MEKVLTFVERIMIYHVDAVLLAMALIIFLVGVVVLYKKGLWLGIPICISGILLVVIAILAELFST